MYLFPFRVINFGFKQMRLDTSILLVLDLELITCILGSLELLEITNTTMTLLSNKVFLLLPLLYFKIYGFNITVTNRWIEYVN